LICDEATVIEGAVVSTIVIVNCPEAVLPAPSVAEQLTFVAPIGNREPEPGVQDALRFPLTESVAVAV
jgi:hypothetical protein